MSLSTADLYEVAKLFFPSEVPEPIDLQRFYRTPKLQYVVLTAIHEFCKGDAFFKVVGDKPMPKFTPYGVGDILKSIYNGVNPATLEERIKSNILARTTIGRTFRPFVQNPETWQPSWTEAPSY